MQPKRAGHPAIDHLKALEPHPGQRLRDLFRDGYISRPSGQDPYDGLPHQLREPSALGEPWSRFIFGGKREISLVWMGPSPIAASELGGGKNGVQNPLQPERPLPPQRG